MMMMMMMMKRRRSGMEGDKEWSEFDDRRYVECGDDKMEVMMMTMMINNNHQSTYLTEHPFPDIALIEPPIDQWTRTAIHHQPRTHMIDTCIDNELARYQQWICFFFPLSHNHSMMMKRRNAENATWQAHNIHYLVVWQSNKAFQINEVNEAKPIHRLICFSNLNANSFLWNIRVVMRMIEMRLK